jgi:hypothetical protein
VTEALVIDLRDKKNPPPDDPERAPHGWVWDKNNRHGGGWQPRKRRTAGFFGKDEPDVEEKVQEILEDRGFQDPAPAWQDTKPPKVPRPRVKVTAKVKSEITAGVGVLGAILLPPGIADAVVPLLCQSPKVVAFFTDDASDWMLWVKLGAALAPVGIAVTRHHIIKTVEIVEETDEEGNVIGLAAVPRDMSEYATDAA